MKLAVVTRADNKLAYTKFTLPIIEAYAEKCKADFVILDHEPPILTDDKLPHWRILAAKELFDIYDRILLLDADILINKSCPNIFDIVPPYTIGSIYEDVGSRKQHRRNLIQQIQKQYGDIGWLAGYTNAGCFIFSKPHSNILDSINGKYWTGFGSVDLQIGYNICKFSHFVHELPYTWNHMSMFSESWNSNADRFKSYIIHYAGRVDRWTDCPVGMKKTEFMKRDYERLKSETCL